MAIRLQSEYDAHMDDPLARYQSGCQVLLRNPFARLHQRKRYEQSEYRYYLYWCTCEYRISFYFDFDADSYPLPLSLTQVDHLLLLLQLWLLLYRLSSPLSDRQDQNLYYFHCLVLQDKELAMPFLHAAFHLRKYPLPKYLPCFSLLGLSKKGRHCLCTASYRLFG